MGLNNINELHELRSRVIHGERARDTLARIEEVREKKARGEVLTDDDMLFNRPPSTDELELARPVSDEELRDAMQFMRQDRANAKPQQRGKKAVVKEAPDLFALEIPAKMG